MKTAFKAKIIFETDKYKSINFHEGEETLTLQKIMDEINAGNYELEVIDDGLTNHFEPVFIFKQK